MIIQCPHCCTELELPDESVGWKVQCIYCNEKFLATEEFIRKQREAMKRKTCRLKAGAHKAENVNTQKKVMGADGKKNLNDAGESESGIGTLLLAIVVALTWPIWIVPLIFIHSLFGLGSNGKGLDLVEREQTQWLYGTGRYAKKD